VTRETKEEIEQRAYQRARSFFVVVVVVVVAVVVAVVFVLVVTERSFVILIISLVEILRIYKGRRGPEVGFSRGSVSLTPKGIRSPLSSLLFFSTVVLLFRRFSLLPFLQHALLFTSGFVSVSTALAIQRTTTAPFFIYDQSSKLPRAQASRHFLSGKSILKRTRSQFVH